MASLRFVVSTSADAVETIPSARPKPQSRRARPRMRCVMIDSARTIAPGATPACRRRIDGAAIVWSTLFTSKEQRSAEKNAAGFAPDAPAETMFDATVPHSLSIHAHVERTDPEEQSDVHQDQDHDRRHPLCGAEKTPRRVPRRMAQP